MTHASGEPWAQPAQLAESEARYRTLAESSPLGILVVRDGKVLLANPACVELFGGSSPEELIEKSVLELFDHDSQPLVRERMLAGSKNAPDEVTGVSWAASSHTPESARNIRERSGAYGCNPIGAQIVRRDSSRGCHRGSPGCRSPAASRSPARSPRLVDVVTADAIVRERLRA